MATKMTPSPLDFPEPLHAPYRVRRLLGSGGFGRVFEVERIRDGQVVALKTFTAGTEIARVKREILAARTLEHPHLIRCFAGGVEGGEAYLEMEQAESSLSDLLRAASAGEKTARDRCWESLRHAALGLAELRRQGFTHRDMKPENILFVGGVAKISDFGLTRGGDLKTLTAEGMIIGTPRYMAPEQARGEAPSPAVDVFALGVMFAELFEGDVPWDSRVPTETLMRLARGELAPLPRTSTALTAQQFRLISACLSIDPTQRPTDLESFCRDLGELSKPADKPPHADATQILSADKPDRATSQLATHSVRSAPSPPPPSSASALSSPPARGRIGVGLLLLGLVLGPAFWSLLTPPPALPAPAVTPATSPLKTSQDMAPVQALIRELEVASNLFTDRAGRVFPMDQRQPDFRSLLDGDPARWGELVAAVPSLEQSLNWLRTAPRDRRLTTSERESWVAADQLFLDREIAPPFAPLLPETPPSKPSVTAATADLARIEAAFTAGKQDLLDESDRVPASLVEQVRWLRFSAGADPIKKSRLFWMKSEVRRDVPRWLGTESLSRRFFQVGFSALQTESIAGEELAFRTWGNMSIRLGAFAGGALDLPLPQLFPAMDVARLPPAAALFAASAAKASLKLRQVAAEDLLGEEALYLTLLRRACQATSSLPIAPQLKRLLSTSAFLMSEFTNRDRLEQAQAVVLELSRDPAFAGQGDHLAHCGVPLLQRLAQAPARLVTGPDGVQLRALFRVCVETDHEDNPSDLNLQQQIRIRLGLFEP